MHPLHEFKVTGHWEGGRGGVGEVQAEHVSTIISLPKSISGSGRGMNPEEMLAATAASCYLATLAIILEKRGIAFARLAVDSICVMDAEKLKISSLTHHPRVELTPGAAAVDKAALTDALHRAEKMCLISNAIRGNVEINLVIDERTVS